MLRRPLGGNRDRGGLSTDYLENFRRVLDTFLRNHRSDIRACDFLQAYND